jgi:hypothetical protein
MAYSRALKQTLSFERRILGASTWASPNRPSFPVIPLLLDSDSPHVFVRTRNDRQTNKRELLFRRNHALGAPSVRCQTSKREPKMSNENKNNSNKNFVRPQNGENPLDIEIMSANAFPGGFQAIATAYGDYTKKSFEDTKSFVEKLSSVRSVDKAIEVQTEFARAAYETFIEESQKIAALYGELAKQTCGGFFSKMPLTVR